MTLQQSLQDTAEDLREQMDTILSAICKGKTGEQRLVEAMRYTLFSEGKRLRPFLVMAAASLFGVGKSSALNVAASIEFLHTYSLIHDDLPAMDNDTIRRGKPSCHIAFDEATAILAGDALLTLAFEVLAHPSTHSDPNVRAELVLAVAEACGARGMVGGQMMDMLSEQKEYNIEEITRLQRMKTGALFAVSCEVGAILGKAARPLRQALRAFAYDIGLAFQITDDLLDAEAGSKTGKRQDKSSGKGTYISAMGAEKSRMQSRLLMQQALSHLDVFGKRADMLREVARFMVERTQ